MSEIDKIYMIDGEYLNQLTDQVKIDRVNKIKLRLNQLEEQIIKQKGVVQIDTEYNKIAVNFMSDELTIKIKKILQD